MFNYCQHCAARLWSDYAKNLGVCPECEEPDKPLQDLEDVLEDLRVSKGAATLWPLCTYKIIP